MWVFAQDGFFSIVADRSNADRLLVRARVKGDLERYWPQAIVHFTPEADYAYRAFLAREEVARVLLELAYTIDYPNYKANIDDQDRRWMRYGMVWKAMAALQEDLMEDDDADPRPVV